ncbi:hypothetical protein [Pseudanabaena sp. FACHB-2040]|uniref:hypothetical protein n=1 Tax=Pseudanabaena sp. FACHB-2040 TaxID=2692859 RepID=UPI001681F983|nr:hypothetical protein [Pseudanabaena sp. FACHB-2040]MBD2256657.1 hypothetical protein [Pseudanabaena sp. FACHB-2040]
MSLFDKLAAIEDIGAKIETRLGVPQRRYLLVRHHGVDEQKRPTLTDYLILPKPLINTASPRLIGLLIGNEEQGVSVSSTDLTAEFSRVTPYEWLVRPDSKRVTAVVDPSVQTFSDGSVAVEYTNPVTKQLAGGTPCRIIQVGTSDPTLWKLILRRDKD